MTPAELFRIPRGTAAIPHELRKDTGLIRTAERFRCAEEVSHFVDQYCCIYDPPSGGRQIVGSWMPFRLWESQKNALRLLDANRHLIWLKARQLGMTWLALAYSLHTLLFAPGATVLLFSRRDDEACDMLARLKGMYKRLPLWMRFDQCSDGNGHEWVMPSGSRAMAFPTTAGDSYAASLAVVDEADLVPDLDKLLGAVKPTIDAGGKLLLLGRVDKSKPQSPFKRIYRGAVAGENGYTPVFLPWFARPGRTQEWYEAQKAEALSRTGSLDWLHEQYPATDVEALAPNSLDKRIPPAWMERCYRPDKPLFTVGVSDDLAPHSCPAIPGSNVWALPDKDRRYVVGLDPAEGNPASDDSALCVLDDQGAQVAEVAGKFDPTTLAHYADRIGLWYHREAGVMVERNNHGAGVLAWWAQNGKCRLLKGHDGKHGWLSNRPGKVLLYDATAELFQSNSVVLRSFAAYQQLQSIEGNTLRAPAGEHDDLADAFALAAAALPQAKPSSWRMRTF